jgi:hypothetical protein
MMFWEIRRAILCLALGLICLLCSCTIGNLTEAAASEVAAAAAASEIAGGGVKLSG